MEFLFLIIKKMYACLFFCKELFVCRLAGHAIPLFLEANMLPITFLYCDSMSTLLHDITVNNNKATANIISLTQYTIVYVCRKFYVKSSRLEIQNNCFSRLGVKLLIKIL